MSKIVKSKESPNAADSGRRSFFFKLGAGVSTALASTAVVARSDAKDSDAALRLALLEDETSLRKLHRSFERALDRGRYEEAVALFAAEAEVVFNGGVFAGRGRGVDRLFNMRFRAGKTGRRIEPAPGFELDAEARQERIELSSDRLSATASFPYSIQVGAPIEAAGSLVSMARLHGEGVRTWWEGGIYRLRYRRAAVAGGWRIGRLEYRTLARADYRLGRAYAGPIEVSPLTVRYPVDPQGPDALV